MKYLILFVSAVAILIGITAFGENAIEKSSGLHTGLLNEAPVMKKVLNGKALSVLQDPVICLSGAWVNSENGTDTWFYSHENFKIQMIFFSTGHNGYVQVKFKIKGLNQDGDKVKISETHLVTMDMVDGGNGYMWWKPGNISPGIYDVTIKVKKGSIKGGGSAKVRFAVVPPSWR